MYYLSATSALALERHLHWSTKPQGRLLWARLLCCFSKNKQLHKILWTFVVYIIFSKFWKCNNNHPKCCPPPPKGFLQVDYYSHKIASFEERLCLSVRLLAIWNNVFLIVRIYTKFLILTVIFFNSSDFG
jgi:hypothetical protein